MSRSLFARVAVTLWLAGGAAQAADWHVQQIDIPARVVAVETADGHARVNAGGLWYRIALDGAESKLEFVDRVVRPKLPEEALPDGRVAIGNRDIAQAWLAEPTDRYDHGVLGDKIEAGSLVIELRDGSRQTIRLKDDAVFEDLAPRLADLDGDGHDEIVVVKSYLKRGAALAVIAERKGKYDIVAETPPLGAPHQWLNPAGIADFTGDGKPDIALVRQPHAVGALELWTWNAGALRKLAETADTANHVSGTRAIDMSAAADFDGDGVTDIAVPSFDREHVRLLSFATQESTDSKESKDAKETKPREIASVALPAKAVTDLALVTDGQGPPAIAVGLADGSLVVIRRNQ